MIEQAFVLAAGFGKRMLPITERIPKALVKVNNICLIERIFDDLRDSGVRKIVINSHYLADKVKEFVICYGKRNKKIEFELVYEPNILETGGAIVNILDKLNHDPFFVINCDVLIPRTKSEIIYSLMSNKWNHKTMNALLLLQDKESAVGYDGKGDFFINKEGRLSQDPERNDKIFAGIHITKPENFSGQKVGYEKTMNIYKKLNFNKFAFIDNPYDWLHIGTPESIKLAEKFLSDKELT